MIARVTSEGWQGDVRAPCCLLPPMLDRSEHAEAE